MHKILILKQGDVSAGDDLSRKLNSLTDGDFSYDVCNYESLKIYFLNNGPESIKVTFKGKDIREFDFVYFRSWTRVQPIATAIAYYLKHFNLKFIDTSVGLPKSGSKLLQTMLLQLNNFPMPRTVYLSSQIIETEIDEVIEILKFPLIMKSTSGSKGSDNYLVNNKEEILERIDTAVEFIFQEFIPNKFDYRILVLGEKVRVAEKRIRDSNISHKNNVSAGAREEFIDVQSVVELHDLAIKAAKLFERQVAGVDIVISEKDLKPYLLEVNPSPGFTLDDTSPELGELQNYLSSLAK